LPVEEDELETAISDAMRLYGHLGPFLVIGVRMGRIAKRILNPEAKEGMKMQVTIKIPFFTPFSCAIDGIQAATSCTIGNQKLRIEDSQEEIVGRFQLQNPPRTLEIAVNQKIIKELAKKMSEGTTSEELAMQIAFMPESHLFKIEKQ